MSEKFEGGVPPQEKGEKIQTPEVARHLSFIKESAWQFRDLSTEREEEIEQSFKIAFERLPENEQKAISLELQALGVEIGTLDEQNDGIAIIRQSEMVNRVREVMDRSGVVASAKEGGVDRTKEAIAELAGEAIAYLGEYEEFAQSVKNKSEDIKQNAEYLVAIASGIRQELERLQLTNVASVQSRGELKKERSARLPMITSVSMLGNKLDPVIDLEGVIGFSTLNKLAKEFSRAKHYLEEAVLRSEPEE
ncbi:MAG: hypothetical protein CO002_01135 [Candidatus Portnoybacteria bacterium CG_4_8_14_3_um_filter_44_10]|uniref:Uncharacterized protein n=3 Tax=Candidatus Portnoyibacteriota TaxID=1817913 RepID=A0A2H0KPK3_9BACT|nr:MAG: hypothetical protein COV85_03980 [Candidatus Portnoybacteria bacterium CG11_big_fil_rev_8_21_14_0_20_44_10]PIW75581.1 MAG: hypothetical protein CO002_01135 [Candidatus Portnoybacteria bacterium CG_4_8_14_3_um_filter_44_10]PIZ68683.1 MAG: hypothetical protein COY11_05785 [Candidatus Portnoybacteria bacterium CG_4_10_14_0_2_um_filter_44_20]